MVESLSSPVCQALLGCLYKVYPSGVSKSNADTTSTHYATEKRGKKERQGMDFYTEAQAAFQDRFETQPLAERLKDLIVSDRIHPDQHQPFIESRDFFFLSTVNGRGEPTVSYKGGGVGLVTVVDDQTIAFPIYDGNGMFLSVGNLDETAKLGLLFIDFETPNRLRVQASTKTTSDQDELMAQYPGALLIVRAEITQIFANCARYVHTHHRVKASPYVPDALTGTQPHPSWKRIDIMQDVLPSNDQARTEQEGGAINIGDYAAKLESGDS